MRPINARGAAKKRCTSSLNKKIRKAQKKKRCLGLIRHIRKRTTFVQTVFTSSWNFTKAIMTLKNRPREPKRKMIKVSNKTNQ